ncbi:MAG: phosphate ABC transporter permease PstA [Acholeplasmataceae bacterium]|jgi:phosphate transport system permease protein
MKANMKLKNRYDKIASTSVYTLGFLGVIILSMIIFYVTTTGLSLVSWDTITGDSATINTNVYLDTGAGTYIPDKTLTEEIYYSETWGIGLIDTRDREGHPIIEIAYLHPESPLLTALDKNNNDEEGYPIEIEIKLNTAIEKAIFNNFTSFAFLTDGAEVMRDQFEQATSISDLTVQIVGGGIRGSVITTIWMIGLTLILSVPVGVSTAIYFNEFAKRTRFSSIIRNLVDMLTGVPSIIYGLLGAAVFIPLLNATIGTGGGSVLSGALTMSVILLPTIIKSTEEALKIIPDDLRKGSLALGANQTQTIFNVVLPNATPGILTGVLLGIGRIMGESAALIFAVGAVIKDSVFLTERSSTLAVHIWVIMGGEAPNFELAAAIAIIILVVVFVINFIVKIFAHQLQKNMNWS